SGKTVTSLSIMRLVPSPGEITRGEVLFGGENLLALPERTMRSLRGRKISKMSQEPMTSLNPVYTLGSQLAEVIRVQQTASRAAPAQDVGGAGEPPLVRVGSVRHSRRVDVERVGPAP